MNRRGAACALVATVLFGITTPFSKRLLSGVNPWLMAGLLYLGGGAGLVAVRLCLAAAGRSGTGERLRGTDWVWLAAATVFGGLLAPVALMAGLARTAPASASLLLSLECIFTAALAWGVFGERFNGRVLAGGAVVLGGGLLLSWTGEPRLEGFAGPLLISGACLGWAMDNNLTRRIAAGDALQIAMVKCFAAGAVNTGLALAFFKRFPPAEAWVPACLIGFMGYGVSLFFFVLALRHIGAARAGAYFSTGPFVGAALSVMMGMERVTGRLLAGGAVLSVGVALLLSERRSEAR